MNIRTLSAKFNQGIAYNALFYVIYKIVSTFLSFALFATLTTHDFATWANINSIIFLLLLWLDCGFKKSIARYCPEYAQNRTAITTFVKKIIIFQATLLLIAVPLFLFLSKTLANTLHLTAHHMFFVLGSGIFLTQGIVAVLRLIFHAHFWQKQFNSLSTFMVLLETIITLVLMASIKESHTLLHSIFITKISTGLILNSSALYLLFKLYKKQLYPKNNPINTKKLNKAFIKHSTIMWGNNILKSLTERNTLVPLFTHAFGPAMANLFKVANDGALLFYRTVTKTIGTTDTSLLAYIETDNNKQSLLPIAFKKLTTQITRLALPLLGILILVLLKGYKLFNNPFVFHTFIIITISYLLEALLSPYERVLEVKRKYIFLFYAYTPYICIILSLILSNRITSIGLLPLICIIHGVRLVSSLLMARFARVIYSVRFPIRYTLTLLGGTVCACVSMHYLFFFISESSFYPALCSFLYSFANK